MTEQTIATTERRPARPSPRPSGSTAGRARTRPRTGNLRKGEAFWGYLLIAPTAIGLLTLSIWPAIQTFSFSFTTWGSFGGHTFTGLTNYVAVLQDPEFGQALINTFLFTGMTLISVPLAIGLAALLNRRGLRGVGVYRTLYFLPVVTLPAAIALVWKLLYNGDFGLVNWFLGIFGVHGVSWLANGSTAIYAIGIVSIWSSIGYNMVLFLAGMQAIPAEYYEAASIDGAGPLRQFFRITVPLITPTTFFVAVITVINSLQAFDLVYLMVGPTSPAIQNAETVVYLFYQKGIIQGQGGYAAAIVFVLLLIILVLTLFQFRFQKRWVHYG
jgi:multiple sugar transport system permease protein